MKQLNISVNPSVAADKPMRNILGMNNLPRIGAKKSYPIQKEWFDALNLKHVRHHDASLDNPGQQLLDVSRVFPLFHLDENDPKNYIFNQSDDYMQSLVGSDIEIDYRLGECIDHSGFGRLIQPPEDAEKWARICKNIIAHYKDCQWNGMRLNIRRVTVWEEPDNPVLFGGTVEDYSKLYCAVYKLFKQEWPDIQVGGPTVMGGGYPFMEAFLDICKAEGVEPDYVTITHYARELNVIPDSAKKIRGLLDARGFMNTKVIIAEWHLGPLNWNDFSAKMRLHGFSTSESAAFAAATLIRLMDIDYLDAAFFYAWGVTAWSVYNIVERKMELLPVYYGLKFFNELAAKCEERLAVEWDGADNTEALAGKTADGKVLLLVSCYDTIKTEFTCKVEGAVSCKVKSVLAEYDEKKAAEGEALEMNADGSVTFGQVRAGSDVFLLEFAF